MASSGELYGAFACVLIPFDGTIRELSAKLALALNVGQFDVAPGEYPPHEEAGATEVLGWEVWLSAEPIAGCYRLEMKTEHSLEEEFNGKMYDLSPWLARLISLLCNADARPASLGPSE